jgi:hypothetical protein
MHGDAAHAQGVSIASKRNPAMSTDAPCSMACSRSGGTGSGSP